MTRLIGRDTRSIDGSKNHAVGDRNKEKNFETAQNRKEALFKKVRAQEAAAREARKPVLPDPQHEEIFKKVAKNPPAWLLNIQKFFSKLGFRRGA